MERKAYVIEIDGKYTTGSGRSIYLTDFSKCRVYIHKGHAKNSITHMKKGYYVSDMAERAVIRTVTIKLEE